MKLYQGISERALESIAADGVRAPSYWGTRDQAEAFVREHGSDGVLIEADIDRDDLKVSVLMAAALYEEGEIEAMPDADDLEYSLEYLGGVTCHGIVRDFEVVDAEPSSVPSPRMGP